MHMIWGGAKSMLLFSALSYFIVELSVDRCEGFDEWFRRRRRGEVLDPV